MRYHKNADALIATILSRCSREAMLLASVLFGDVNPSGKLSVSFPYDVGTFADILMIT